jgi:hypothetical protein
VRAASIGNLSAEIAARRYLFTQAQRALSADGIASPVGMSVIVISGPCSGTPQADMPAGAAEVRFYPSSPFGEPKALKPHLVAPTRKTSVSPYCTLVQSEPTAGVVWPQRHCAQRNFIDSCQNSLQQMAITVRLGFGHHPRNEATLRI